MSYYQLSHNEYSKLFFSPTNIQTIQNELIHLFICKYGNVPKEINQTNILEMMYQIFYTSTRAPMPNYVGTQCDIRTPNRTITEMDREVIVMLFDGIANDIDQTLLTNSYKFREIAVWDPKWGMRPYAPIKLRQKRYINGEFNMNY